ncbi:MAG TPA: GSU2403 family nucleotidyltransferase fold protein [Vicinamibacterales bacterium]|nr:GSU2403 family nucleotidyltransferase fold protein [Vicinamibacterales bacterium]
MSDSDRHFSRLVEALRPWLGQIILVGGWAHQLYRLRPEASSLSYPVLRTDDADLALDPRSFKKSENMRVRLLELGFAEDMSGDDRPPVTHYVPSASGAGFYAEFLTPLVGGEYSRSGSRQVTERVAGVVAQKLRYLEVLIVDPWTVTVDSASGFDLPKPATVLVANPCSYLVHKLLIHDRRKAEDQAKDALYIHDTIELFGSSLATLEKIWSESIESTLSSRAQRHLFAQVKLLFGSVNDTLRDAARMATGRRLSPAEIQARCEAGLQVILRSH